MTSNRNLARPMFESRAVKIAAATALVVGLGVGVRAYAQQHPDAASGKGPHVHTAEMCDLMEAHQAGMLAFAEVRLGITDAERPAWTKLVTAVKTSSAPLKQLCLSTAGQPEPKTLPDHLHRMEAMETARLEQLRQVTPAIEDLYGMLTPKQKEIADRLVEGMMPHGPGPGFGPGPHHPPFPPADAKTPD